MIDRPQFRERAAGNHEPRTGQNTGSVRLTRPLFDQQIRGIRHHPPADVISPAARIRPSRLTPESFRAIAGRPDVPMKSLLSKGGGMR